MARYATYLVGRSCKRSDVRYAHGWIILPSKFSQRPQKLGTPSQIARSPEDVTMMSLDDNRTRKRNTPGDQSMRRTIQDLVSSIDPNVKIEPEVEDVREITVHILN